MRVLMTAGAALLGAIAAAPAQAQQGGTYMWCLAWTDNGAEQSYYYSGFFAAGAWEKDRKALKFKSFVEDQDDEISAATVKATCYDPAEYDKAVAVRNAAMKAGPGTILSWEG